MDDTEEFEMKLMEQIPFEFFKFSMCHKLADYLDPENSVEGNNWRFLAEKLGYSTHEILVFESRQASHGSNTVKVLQSYGNKQGSSVNELLRAVKEIKRPDALMILQQFIPDIIKSYRESSVKKKHRHQDLIENDCGCTSCDASCASFSSCSHSHQKSMMSQGNGYSMFTSSDRMSGTDPNKSYQRHQSLDLTCIHSRLPMFDHASPEFKRQRSMPLSESMMVRSHDSRSQYYQDLEPMDHSQIREDPVPPARALMRGLPRYNNHHGVPILNSAVHTADSENIFRQPFTGGQFSRQTERAGLKLEIPSPTEMFHRQHSGDFLSPSPTPSTPSTPLGHLQKLANERAFQPGEDYKGLMKMKRDEELLQGKAGQPDEKMDMLSPKTGAGCHQGNHSDRQGNFRTSPRSSGPPSAFPLRAKSCSASPSSTPQLTKSASLPSDLKPAEFRKGFQHIRVFVTYSEDDKKHSQRVISLCECLMKNTFTCCMDTLPRRLPEERRSGWYQRQFNEADFILVVMSPKYRTEVDSCDTADEADDSDSFSSCNGEMNDLNVGLSRLHTKDIYKLMYNEYIHSGTRCMRFVPLIFPGMCKDIIPRWLLDCNNGLYYFWPKQYKDLLWMLTKPENRVPSQPTPPVNGCSGEGENCLMPESE